MLNTRADDLFYEVTEQTNKIIQSILLNTYRMLLSSVKQRGEQVYLVRILVLLGQLLSQMLWLLGMISHTAVGLRREKWVILKFRGAVNN